jgi:hypothetical protein
MPFAVRIVGKVDEARLFGPRLRMTSVYEVVPGTGGFTIHDSIENLGDSPCDLELLYHWNLGPPLLEEGSKVVAAVKKATPRDSRAVEGALTYDVYGAPTPGFSEQVYFLDLAGKAGKTKVMLANRAADQGFSLGFDLEELPCFTLWKCTRGLKEGYVTGLEPGINLPNPKPVEKAAGRVVALAPGERRTASTRAEVLVTTEKVACVAKEIKEMTE